METKNNKTKFHKKKIRSFKPKHGIDTNGKKYIYNGSIEKPIAPIYSFDLKLSVKNLQCQISTLLPHIFNKTEPKPLAKKIHLLLRDFLNKNEVKFSNSKLYSFLMHWCGSVAYKKSLIQHTNRFDLEGKTTEAITTEEKRDAKKALEFYLQQLEWKQYNATKQARKKKDK